VVGSHKSRSTAEADRALVEEACWRFASKPANMLFLISDGKVVYATPKGEQVLGIAPEQRSCGGDVFQLIAVAPEYLDVSQESFRRRSQGEPVAPVDCALLTRDGRRIEGVLETELVERQGRRALFGIFTGRDSDPDS
jgi:PAS domain S-box-containing protein